MPRLTADYEDAALEGSVDPARLPYAEREKFLEGIVERAKAKVAAKDPAATIAVIDEGLRLVARVKNFIAKDWRLRLLAIRARAHVARGDKAAALADYDAALTGENPAAKLVIERADLLVALGRRADATATVRALLVYATGAKEWLAKHDAPKDPTRVRHAKFGEGVVIGIEGHGEQQTLTIKFPDGQKKLRRGFVEVL